VRATAIVMWMLLRVKRVVLKDAEDRKGRGKMGGPGPRGADGERHITRGLIGPMIGGV
jgi:hypothetical protein